VISGFDMDKTKTEYVVCKEVHKSEVYTYVCVQVYIFYMTKRYETERHEKARKVKGEGGGNLVMKRGRG
jgi:hypothetical protein